MNCTCGGKDKLSQMCLVCLDKCYKNLTQQRKDVFEWMRYRARDDAYKSKTNGGNTHGTR